MRENRYLGRSIFIIAVLVIAFSASSCTSAIPPVNAGPDGIAIKGYDPVAYFTTGMPVKGDTRFLYEWKGAKWLFSSREHLELFSSDPGRYAPQYGGYCAYAVSQGTTADIDPDSWNIVDGKLYLNLDMKVQKLWLEKMAEYIKQADKNWPSVLTK